MIVPQSTNATISAEWRIFFFYFECQPRKWLNASWNVLSPNFLGTPTELYKSSLCFLLCHQLLLDSPVFEEGKTQIDSFLVRSSSQNLRFLRYWPYCKLECFWMLLLSGPASRFLFEGLEGLPSGFFHSPSLFLAYHPKRMDFRIGYWKAFRSFWDRLDKSCLQIQVVMTNVWMSPINLTLN